MLIPQLCFASVFSLSSRTSYAIAQVLTEHLRRAWSEDGGQDIAEYAVMLAVILVIVVGTIRLIGTNSNSVFSAAASSIQ
jgi:Flp pilus assembly pilin Flp